LASLLAQVLPLAVGSALSPAMFGLQILNLSRPRSPMAWAWSMAAGAAALLLVATLAAFLLHVSTKGTHASPEMRGAVKAAAGMILLGVAVRVLTRPAADHPPSRLLEEPEKARSWVRPAAVVVGAGLVAPNVALYFPAVHEVATSGEPAGARAALVVFVFAMAMLPGAGPPLAVMALGDRARPPLDAINRWVTEHRRGFTATLCVVFGLVLAGLGLIQLL